MQLTDNHITLLHRVNGVPQSVYEVFHFVNGRDKDPVSRGFVEIPLINYDSSKHNIEFQARYGTLYELAPLNTSIRKRFINNWELVIELPDFIP